jgi:hypothetical protein
VLPHALDARRSFQNLIEQNHRSNTSAARRKNFVISTLATLA